MARVFQDDGFLAWEAYASTGMFGLSDAARVVFHCRTDPSRRARFVEYDGDKAAAERAMVTLSDGELVRLLRMARTVD